MFRKSLSWWALLVAVLKEIMVCADYHERDAEFGTSPSRPEHAGEGPVTYVNGLRLLRLAALAVDQLRLAL